MNRYIGLDAHSSSCTAAVVGPAGKRLQSQVIETNAQTVINFLLTIPENRHLCIEEGTHANWLYEVLLPHVQEIASVTVFASQAEYLLNFPSTGIALLQLVSWLPFVALIRHYCFFWDLNLTGK